VGRDRSKVRHGEDRDKDFVENIDFADDKVAVHYMPVQGERLAEWKPSRSRER